MSNVTQRTGGVGTQHPETNHCCGSGTVDAVEGAENSGINAGSKAGSEERVKTHTCANCSLKARYDRNPGSLIGRFWKWHTGFCPRWKSYMKSLTDEERATVVQKYGLKH